MTEVNSIKRDRSSQTPKFTITDFVQDFDISANDTVDKIGDMLATLIRELAKQRIINADIS